jgi:hypothetical protein
VRGSVTPNGGQPVGYTVRFAAARPAPYASSHIVWSQRSTGLPLPVIFTARLCANTSAS